MKRIGFQILSGIALLSSTAYAETIEIFEKEENWACHNEVSLEIGNTWTLCGPIRFKDYEMDRVRLIYIKHAGTHKATGNKTLDVPLLYIDLESGEMIGVRMPPEGQDKKASYLSLWNYTLKKIEKTKKESQKALEESKQSKQ